MGNIKSIAAGLFLGIAAVAMTATSALSMPMTVPSSLNPGDQYRLAFVSSMTRDATSLLIADYNNFVDGLGMGATGISGWKAIASTASVHARDNTGTNPSATGVPIFLLNDTKVADNYADLWDGTLDTALQIREDGSLFTASSLLVFTGTLLNGTFDATYSISTGATVRTGNAGSTSSGWVANGIVPAPSASLPFYAISPLLTVQATGVIPEPTTLAILGLGLAGLGVMRRRRRSRALKV